MLKTLIAMFVLSVSTIIATPARADYRTDICAPGNVWDGTSSTGVNGADPLSMLTESQDHITVVGHSDGATVLHLFGSMDDITYYDSGITITVSGAGDFSKTLVYQTVFLRLVSENDVTITAAVCAYEN